jgi:hypothetical protein
LYLAVYTLAQALIPLVNRYQDALRPLADGFSEFCLGESDGAYHGPRIFLASPYCGLHFGPHLFLVGTYFIQ